MMICAQLLAGVALGIFGAVPAATAFDPDTTPADHQAAQSQPIRLGVSGSSQEHVISGAFAYCYAGTLGALVSNGTNLFILSNNHVLAKENQPDSTVLSANGNLIVQPALLDRDPCPGLNANLTSDQVAFGVSYVPLQFCKGKTCPVNTVDAAVAGTTVNDVSADGEILGIGVLSSTVLNYAGTPARIVVQKSGRTTGHTKGTVEAIGVSLKVSYDSGTAYFENQIRIRGCSMQFSDAGDLGSLIVTLPADGTGAAQPVGLLFAGGGADTFANPAGSVLSALGSVVGSVGFVGGMPAGMALSGDDATQSDCAVPTSTGGKGRNPRGSGPTSVASVAAIKARNGDRLMALPEVVGHGIGFDDAGQPVIELYLQTGRRATSIPSDVEGVPVRTVVTGPIRAY